MAIIVNKFCADMFPSLLRLAAVALTLPVHPADYKKEFSLKNHLKKCEVNQLLPKRFDTLMLISAEGPLVAEFDFQPPPRLK